MTGKISLSLVQSLDGYVADRNYATEFAEGYPGPNLKDVYSQENPFDMFKFYQETTIIVMGARTYRQGYAQGFPKQDIYVVTDQDPANQGRIHFVKARRIVKLMLAKKKQGHQIYILGGAMTANLFIKEQAIDRYMIATVPYILGTGRRLFYPQAQQIPLQLDQVDVMGGMTLQIYSPRP
ncbi:dihydrofolate reductase [Aerococcus urinaehominis]|uniref:Dihydrofolate reductase n=1 Tax=Aerococcus urinaehominis TaxID=128944 RepID=A0A0X8FLQ4_9LACT|nr:dihydrofolate reductase family protein [Aerococcus urinaehominis]AMB99605.1 dihydrofolate reductase [Aerococcus urinaehominis]SDL87168.1 Dihydrofolate reductase [Aerococcus urinaehominis]